MEYMYLYYKLLCTKIVSVLLHVMLFFCQKYTHPFRNFFHFSFFSVFVFFFFPVCRTEADNRDDFIQAELVEGRVKVTVKVDGRLKVTIISRNQTTEYSCEINNIFTEKQE